MTVSATHFVNSLRVRREIIRLASEQAPELWTVRVQAAEVWDAVEHLRQVMDTEVWRDARFQQRQQVT
jgi:kynureninase